MRIPASNFAEAHFSRHSIRSADVRRRAPLFEATGKASASSTKRCLQRACRIQHRHSATRHEHGTASQGRLERGRWTADPGRHVTRSNAARSARSHPLGYGDAAINAYVFGGGTGLVHLAPSRGTATRRQAGFEEGPRFRASGSSRRKRPWGAKPLGTRHPAGAGSLQWPRRPRFSKSGCFSIVPPGSAKGFPPGGPGATKALRSRVQTEIRAKAYLLIIYAETHP